MNKIISSNIPLNIFQTWKTKSLPHEMSKIVQQLKNDNPEFNHYLFDDNECLQFILLNFKPIVGWAFEQLIPGAYKADLFRLCVLYKLGGIYIDIKFSCVKNCKLIQLTDKEHFVRDRDHIVRKGSVYNAFMVCKPGNPFLMHCIMQIIYNIRVNYYGEISLDPTGPQLLGKINDIFGYRINMDMIHKKSGGIVLYKGKPFLNTVYPAYNKERNTNIPHYSVCWDKRMIYKHNLIHYQNYNHQYNQYKLLKIISKRLKNQRKYNKKMVMGGGRNKI